MLHIPESIHIPDAWFPFYPRTHHYSGWLEWLLGWTDGRCSFSFSSQWHLLPFNFRHLVSGHISDLSLEFLHFLNLKSLYPRKVLTAMCQHPTCLVLQLPFLLLETQRGSWAVHPSASSPSSCSPPSRLCCSDTRPRPWAVTLARTLKAFPFPVLVLLSALPAKSSHDFTSALHILRPPGSTSTSRLCDQLSVWPWPALSHIL